MSTENGYLRAAAVQFRASGNLLDNCERITEKLTRLSADGVRVAAFPECAATSYDDTVIIAVTPNDLVEAERRISAACQLTSMYAVVGMPYDHDGNRYNGAVVWGPDGSCVARYAKIQLIGETWFTPGSRPVLFRVDDVPCSVIICYDARFPELVRLPVLAGAQVVFYLSCETDITDEPRMDQYRSQLVARAVENTVYVICANTPMGEVWMEDGTPHTWGRNANGRSRIIQPDGTIVEEASVWGEDTVIADLDIGSATRQLAELSRESPTFRDWWDSGLRLLGPESP